MGQDIHIVIEGKIGDKWVGFCNPDQLPSLEVDKGGRYPTLRVRWTVLWYFMCGAGGWSEEARKDKFGNPLFKSRGFPEDASDLSHYYLLRDDLHSHSWLTIDEFMLCYELLIYHQKQEYPEHSNHYGFTERDFLGDFYGLRFDNIPIRLVFAFDN